MTSAYDKQEGGSHYKNLAIQPMQYSMANKLDALQHTVIKYVTRFREKAGVEDLRKAIHCIEMLIEHEGATEMDAPAPVMDAPPWLDWNGENLVGPTPFPEDSRVDVMFRAGAVLGEQNPRAVIWGHTGGGTDIVAYRFEEKNTKTTAPAMSGAPWAGWDGKNHSGPIGPGRDSTTRVHVRTRTYDSSDPLPISQWVWGHRGTANDIIAWRLAE